MVLNFGCTRRNLAFRGCQYQLITKVHTSRHKTMRDFLSFCYAQVYLLVDNNYKLIITNKHKCIYRMVHRTQILSGTETFCPNLSSRKASGMVSISLSGTLQTKGCMHLVQQNIVQKSISQLQLGATCYFYSTAVCNGPKNGNKLGSTTFIRMRKGS